MNIFDPEQWSLVPFHFWTAMFFIFGCIVGSFLNVCIYRLPRNENIIFPPSHCPNCKYHIPWYLNIPLFTWLWLRGRCANCGAPISVRYFIVELLTGCLFTLSWLCVGTEAPVLALVYCLVIAGLIVSSFIDFEHYVIPDVLTLGGTVCGFLLSFLLPVLHQTYSFKLSLQESVLGILAGGGGLYLVGRLGKMAFGKYRYPVTEGETLTLSEEALECSEEKIPYNEIFYRASDKITISAATAKLTLQPVSPVDTPPQETETQEPETWENVNITLTPSVLKIGDQEWKPTQVKSVEILPKKVSLPREVMGLGDVKLMAAIGAFFGWQAVIFTLFASSLLGSLAGLALIALGKRELSQRIPYGPYIAAGTLLWMLGGYYYVMNWVGEMLKPLL